MRAILAAGLMMLAGLVSHAALAADAAAEAFVNGIYKTYVGSGMNAMGVPLDSEATINRYFEPSLAKMMIDDQKAAQGEVGALDGDPFIDAQDFEIKSFDIKVADTGPGKAMATVRFKNLGTDKVIKLSLVRVGGAWKIFDIDWGADGTLRKLFGH